MRKYFIGFICAVFFPFLSNCTDSGSPSYPTVIYRSELFVDGKTVYPDEVLYPSRLVYNTFAKEVTIKSQAGGSFVTGVYSFSEDGKLKEGQRTIGRSGQDTTFWDAEFKISPNGERIYYYLQTGRFRILAASGEELHYFDIDTSLFIFGGDYSVNNSNELLLFGYGGKYNLYKYSFKGELVGAFNENIYPGRDRESLEKNMFHSLGNSFQVQNGEYYLFIQMTGLVRKFDKNQEEIGEFQIAIPELREMYENYDRRMGMFKDRNASPEPFFNGVIYRNNNFYVYLVRAINDGSLFGYRDKYEKLIYVLNTDLQIQKKIVLKDDFLDGITMRDEDDVRSLLYFPFDVNEKEEIFVPISLKSKILKFVPER